jgi:hypothetical protein
MPNQTIEITNEAIDRVEENADPEWREAALTAVQKTAEELHTFIVDDVWNRMPPSVGTHEHRAMGAVMRRAVKAGWCVGTGRFVASHQPQCHRGPRTVWESRLQ